jgi:hypothetical protein
MARPPFHFIMLQISWGRHWSQRAIRLVNPDRGAVEIKRGADRDAQQTPPQALNFLKKIIDS